RIGPLLHAGEDVLELHHAGIGEEQRWIVSGDERAGRHHLMAVAAEVVEKSRPNLADAAHCSKSSRAAAGSLRATAPALLIWGMRGPLSTQLRPSHISVVAKAPALHTGAGDASPET